MQMKDEMAQLQRDFQTFQRLRNNAERDIATYQSQVAEIRASLVVNLHTFLFPNSFRVKMNPSYQ